MTIASYSLARPPLSRTAQSTMSGGRTEDLTDGWPQILQISKVETDQGYGTAAQGRRQTPPPPALRCWIYKSTETLPASMQAVTYISNMLFEGCVNMG